MYALSYGHYQRDIYAPVFVDLPHFLITMSSLVAITASALLRDFLPYSVK